MNEPLRPPSQDYVHSNITAPSSADSSEEVPPPPSLYFDVGSDKENKQTSYAELRKKHRERWMPPNASSSGSLRSEQVRFYDFTVIVLQKEITLNLFGLSFIFPSSAYFEKY